MQVWLLGWLFWDFFGAALGAVAPLPLPVVPLCPRRLLAHRVCLLPEVCHVALLSALRAPAVRPVQRLERHAPALRAHPALAERYPASARLPLDRVGAAAQCLGYLLGSVAGVLPQVPDLTCRPWPHCLLLPSFLSHSRYAARSVEHMVSSAISRGVLGLFSCCLASLAI